MHAKTYQAKLKHGLDQYREEKTKRRAAEKEARRLQRELDALKEDHKKSRAETLKLVAYTLDRANGRREPVSERGMTADDARSHADREESRPDFAGVATHVLLSRVGDLQRQMEEYLAKKIEYQIMALQQSYVRTLNPTSLADKIRVTYTLLHRIRDENSLISGRSTRGQLITQVEEVLREMGGSVDSTRMSMHDLERQIRALEAQITEEPRALTSAKDRLKPGEHLSTV